MKKGKSLRSLADEYRSEWGQFGSGGVVVFFEGEPQGWINELRNPEHWRPGCIAIDESGKSWVSEGGNDREGAHEWSEIA